jgi:diguanylate cyclase (GGDEF)-like protein
VLSLLQSVEAISACRDRERLPHTLMCAVAVLLGDGADVAIFSREGRGEATLRSFSGPTIMEAALSRWPELLDDVHGDGVIVLREIGDRTYGALPLRSSELAGDQLILAYNVGAADATAHSAAIVVLAGIYGNQIRLLDYSELDTLTRLLNRKTFDETFDRLLTATTGEHEDGARDRRDHLESGAPAWLCVIDIDHFKRVNDSFGHLFGDEVLLRMGELMRRTFRGGDRLFRFGGEEFVVILNAANETLAASSFNRFRATVEKHEFPQVGKVTCSIGFTAVSRLDVPTDVLGRADEALYYAKEHGRNRVCCYERLVSQGAIVKPDATRVEATRDFDIDALFG